MRHFLALFVLFLLPVPGLAAQDIMEGYERTGSVYERLNIGQADAQRCEALCDGDMACQAWVWARPGYHGEDAQCALLSTASTPRRAPGRVTGLAAPLWQRIEAGAERAPSEREIEALQALVPGPRERD